MSDNVVQIPNRRESTDPVLGYLQEIEGLLEDAQQLTQKGVVSTMDEQGEGAVAMAHSKIRIESFILCFSYSLFSSRRYPDSPASAG